VYIPLPTALHREWVPRAAAAGKHILLEKPVALSVADLDVMIQACDKSDVCFMDGVMFMHHDRLRAVLGHISPPGFFGRPTRITSAFTFKADAAFLDGGDIRVRADGDPLGCIGDLGWYCIRIALCCALYESPQKVRCLHMERNADGVPVDATVEIYWPGMVLHFHCSFMHPLRQWVEVVGGDRVLRIDDFVINKSDSQYTIEHGAGLADYDTVPTGTSQTYTMAGCTQEARMFENFAIETLAPTPRTSTNLWWYVAATTQACCDAVMESAGKGGAEVAVAKSSIAFAANGTANDAKRPRLQ
jgi:predicted dehydrogenase